MKSLAIIFAILMFVSCGKDYQGDVYVTEVLQRAYTFEGFYRLENGGYIDIYQYEDNSIYITSEQLITTVNPSNDTFAELPRIVGDYNVVDGKVTLTRNYNYSSGMDVEEDETGNNIQGQRRTDVTIEFVDDKLQLSYKIYSNRLNQNANFIVATRVIGEVNE